MTLIPANIKGIVFDVDGTLVDNIPYHKEAWDRFIENRTPLMDPQTLMSRNHGTIEETIRMAFGNNLSPQEVKSLGDEKESLYRDIFAPHIEEIDGLTNLLERAVKRGIKIGLASMGCAENVAFIMDGLGIRNYFDAVLCGDDVSRGKPDPEIFLKAVEKLGLEPFECVAFEDSPGGIQSALSAGLTVIGITTTHNQGELLEYGAAYTIDNYRQVSA